MEYGFVIPVWIEYIFTHERSHSPRTPHSVYNCWIQFTLLYYFMMAVSKFWNLVALKALMRKWFFSLQVEQEMINSIRDVMKKAIENYPLTAFKEWCLQWPGQVILAASNVYWTADVTKVSTNDGMKSASVIM